MTFCFRAEDDDDEDDAPVFLDEEDVAPSEPDDDEDDAPRTMTDRARKWAASLNARIQTFPPRL